MSDLEHALRDLLVPAGLSRAELMDARASLRAADALSPELREAMAERVNTALAEYVGYCEYAVSFLYGYRPDLFVRLQGEPELQRAPGETSGELCPDRFAPE